MLYTFQTGNIPPMGQRCRGIVSQHSYSRCCLGYAGQLVLGTVGSSHLGTCPWALSSSPKKGHLCCIPKAKVLSNRSRLESQQEQNLLHYYTVGFQASCFQICLPALQFAEDAAAPVLGPGLAFWAPSSLCMTQEYPEDLCRGCMLLLNLLQ